MINRELLLSIQKDVLELCNKYNDSDIELKLEDLAFKLENNSCFVLRKEDNTVDGLVLKERTYIDYDIVRNLRISNQYLKDLMCIIVDVMNYIDKELKRYEGESNMKIMLTKKEFDELFDYLNYLDADPCKTNNCSDEFYCAGCSKRIKWERKLKTYPNKDSIEVILGHKHIANYIRAVNEEKRISDELKKLKDKKNTLINEIAEYSKQFEVRDEDNAVIAFPHFERKE